MLDEILSLAIYEPLPGLEAQSLSTIRQLIGVLGEKGYSRDLLYRASEPGQYVLLRYWKSEDARRAAQEDGEALRCWAKLAQEIRVIRIYETLEAAIDRGHGAAKK